MTPEQRAYWDVDDVMRRLRRIEGQVRGVQSMIESEQSCQKVLIQVAAIEGALKQVSRIVSACSVAEEVMLAQQSPDPTEAIKNALKQLINYA
jgi:DNA-binding FrmR family transcriptional regulator